MSTHGTTELLHEFNCVLNSVSCSIGGLRSALDAFGLVAHKIENRLDELKQLELQVVSHRAELDRREQQLYEKESEVSQSDGKPKEINTSKVVDKVNLNIGGQQFSTSKATLLQFKGSYFEGLVENTHYGDEIFIDHDPKHFSVILNYMREGRIRPSAVNSADYRDLLREFEFFNIPYPSWLQAVPSTIHPENNQQNTTSSCGTPMEALVAIKTWLPHTRFSLVYKASSNGFSSRSFHRSCDNKGPTLTVIQSAEGYIFGGYSPRPWNSSGSYFFHPHTFLFTLTNPHSIPPTRFPLRLNDPLAICCRPDRCTVFGGGYDICVGSDSDKITRNSYSNFPCSFVDLFGFGNLTFTGTCNFRTKEVEVYQCT